MNRWNAEHGYACIVCRAPQPPYSFHALLYTKIVAFFFVLCILYGIACVLYAFCAELQDTHMFF